MSTGKSVVFLCLLLLPVPHINAKNKKKQLLAEIVLRAERVLVVIPLVLDANTADLIVAVRKGNKSGPIISHSPMDDRPVTTLPSGGDARVGGLPGHPPLTEPLPGGVGDRGPKLGSQIVSSDDAFEVYLGGGEYPLDSSPIWRYVAKNALSAPQVAAVEEFRKAIEESEKQRQQKP